MIPILNLMRNQTVISHLKVEIKTQNPYVGIEANAILFSVIVISNKNTFIDSQMYLIFAIRLIFVLI